jgi:hypothetical protein
MNLKKEIFERISSIEKVELSETKKVELKTVEVGKFTSEANKIKKDFDDEYKKQVLAVQGTVVKYNNMIGGLVNNFDAEIDLYKSKVKELGLDFNNTPLAKISEAARKSILNNSDYFKQIMDKLKSI